MSSLIVSDRIFFQNPMIDCIDLAFDPVRISVQGEAIRDLENNVNSSSRRADHADSDDDDHPTLSTSNGRSAGNIYVERQKKRVKLTID